MKKTAAFLYVPALHAGILSFIAEVPEDAPLYLLSEELIKYIDTNFDYLRKEIRALSPEQARKSIQALFPQRTIELLTLTTLETYNNSEQSLILPKEDIFLWLAEKNLEKAHITYNSTFLRWNRTNTLEKKTPSAETLAAFEAADHSSDWWRQVGGAIVKNGDIIAVAHNRHVPSPYTPYIDSDPRNSFHKGVHIELSTALHAEAALIADAARNGTSLKNTELYLTTFPCPPCAKLVAASGIKKLYFLEGYSMLDGEKVLADAGVKIFKLPKKT